MKVSRGISWADERIVDTFAAVNAPAMPQGVVDFTAGWGDSVSMGITSYARENLGSTSHVNKCAFGYSAGEGVGILNSFAIGGNGWSKKSLEWKLRNHKSSCIVRSI